MCALCVVLCLFCWHRLRACQFRLPLPQVVGYFTMITPLAARVRSFAVMLGVLLTGTRARANERSLRMMGRLEGGQVPYYCASAFVFDSRRRLRTRVSRQRAHSQRRTFSAGVRECVSSDRARLWAHARAHKAHELLPSTSRCYFRREQKTFFIKLQPFISLFKSRKAISTHTHTVRTFGNEQYDDATFLCARRASRACKRAHTAT